MIVLPMAGLSRRFFEAGYAQPKYMLELQGKSAFSHALLSFERFFGSERFLIICRDVHETPAFVRAECARWGLPEERLDLVVLEAPTAGQAETVAKGLAEARSAPRAPLTVFNIDTFRPGFCHPESFDPAAVDGYLEVFRGEGTHWSFVRPVDETAPDCRVAEVTEKIRISDLCSDGLYHFRTTQMFLDLFAGVAAKAPAELQGGEYYIAPLYNDAIRAGADVRYRLIDRADVLFCGTPAEYEALRAAPMAGR